ncbi:hypothetical protein Patl1_08280 [Pistacia atlantica]|uniref:Uncharacterized protein n=1 Tax=Pistacia atlantica TaxID=434234 RepID=A0ACC1AJM8_9ROSI|nr:hypothetical protein Patl1_08280 [Pistacia atlantica]
MYKAKMGDKTANEIQVSIDLHPQGGSNSNSSNDDGRRKPTGTTVWAASAHIITALMGSGVLSLAWATAQLGWIFGPIVMLLFSLVTCYTFALFAAAVCCPSGDLVTGNTNDTYMDVIRSKLGGITFEICRVVYYMSLFGVASGYTTESSASLNAIQWSRWFDYGGDKNPFHMNQKQWILIFGCIQIFLSQIYGFGKLRRLSIFVTAVTSFTYSMIGVGLSIAEVSETGKFRGSLTGISFGSVTETQKIWKTFQALGVVAFAYSYFTIFIEIHDAIKSSPSEAKTMEKASVISVGITTLLYMLCGCFGYAAFGDSSPENLLSDSGLHQPFWLLQIANVAIVIHLLGAYQVYCQPLFAFIEKQASKRFPNSAFINREVKIPIPGFGPSNQTLFRLVSRTVFVSITTVISMLLPFFNDGVGLLGALGFWPFTVYFPVEMYIVQKKIQKWSANWIGLQILSFACFIISIAAATGSIAGLVLDLKSFKPFKSAT